MEFQNILYTQCTKYLVRQLIEYFHEPLYMRRLKTILAKFYDIVASSVITGVHRRGISFEGYVEVIDRSIEVRRFLI